MRTPAPYPRTRGERLLTLSMLALTLLAYVMLIRDVASLLQGSHGGLLEVLRAAVFLALLLLLGYGNVVYQVSRLGWLRRHEDHRPGALQDLIASDWEKARSIAVLVPSYREEERTVRQTLLSAALQHHPNLRVTLLLDDPPNSDDPESAAATARTLAIPAEVESMLAEARAIVDAARSHMRRRSAEGDVSEPAELRQLLLTHDELIRWANAHARSTALADHTDRHFVGVTWKRLCEVLITRSRLVSGSLDGAPADMERIRLEYDQLHDWFDTRIDVFQRKRYRNITHEPNKAANLNAYLDLLGQTVVEVQRPDGLWLTRSDDSRGTLIPDATFVLTLDADSMLDPNYALRLASELERPGNERLAVVQTPYSSIPGAPGTVERIAGATTDVQYIIHQGFTYHGATFWVGANALLRKAALDDIRTEAVEDGVPVARFIQDRTVIEDTESTLDLAEKGWRLHNVPLRLAWSATPPDFGSLLIQRSRWANGGLLILPKAFRLLVSGPREPMALRAFAVRLHYLASTAVSSLGLLILLFIPLGGEVNSLWLPLTALPYFVLYGRDMISCGYRASDLLRVFALNLMLVPVHLAGALKSLQQGVTGQRIPFGRTPKVSGRTAAPRWAVLSIWALTAWCSLVAVMGLVDGRWLLAGIAVLAALGYLYSAVVLVGLREGWEDVTRGLRRHSGIRAIQPLPRRGRITPDLAGAHHSDF